MMDNEGFAGVLYSEPSTIGILANVYSAFLVSLTNLINFDKSSHSAVMTGIQLIIIGGIIQFIAGILSFRRNDHLGSTTFVAFAALWSSFGAVQILSSFEEAETVIKGSLAGLVPYACLAMVLTFTALTVNYIMPPVCIATLCVAVFEVVGLYTSWGGKIAGCFEMVIVVVGLYGAATALLKGMFQKYVLPGFGNAPFNVLLFGTKTLQKADSKKKKNTKYAEPMALGHLGNVILSAIFIFKAFDYPESFSISFVWILFGSLCQLTSIYYSFLREDVYHTTLFSFQTLFWLSKGFSYFNNSLFCNYNFFSKSICLEEFSLDNTDHSIDHWVFFCVSILFVTLSLHTRLQAISSAVFALLVIFFSPEIYQNSRLPFICIGCLFFLTSLYATFSSLVNSIAEKAVVPIGAEVCSFQRQETFILFLKNKLEEKIQYQLTSEEALINKNDHLAFLYNLIAVWAALNLSIASLNNDTIGISIFPNVLVPGVVFNLFAAGLATIKQNYNNSILNFHCALLWSVWILARLEDNFPLEGEKFNTMLMLSIIVFLTNICCLAVSFFVGKLWTATFISFQLLAIYLVIYTHKYHQLVYLEYTFLGISGSILSYGTFAYFFNVIFAKEVFPVGKPFLQKRMTNNVIDDAPNCLTLPSHKTSSLRRIATILGNGGVCAIPTDTVYAIAVSTKHPENIQKLYQIKERPLEKPICLCLSNLNQLVPTDPDFSPLLWEFMKSCYPGGISCVVPKGDWIGRLGVGDASKYIGTESSICIRVPDSTVTAHLVDMTGPLAITSANPSGAPDSTHHQMVIESLGEKLDGVLCDGDSSELVASTVVNCLNIDTGGIAFFREGCFPKEKVEEIYEKVRLDLRQSEAGNNIYT